MRALIGWDEGMKPMVCVTCGPAEVSLDGVRVITNRATGGIGRVLARFAMEKGAEVICFRGEGSTAPPPPGDVRGFTTNESLMAGLRETGRELDVIFHAAALSDFMIKRIEGARGAKLDSRGGDVQVTLSPATKVLPLLRGWFPRAVIVGWKFELDGARADALERGARQIRECATDGCVVNGAAFGAGFGLLMPDGRLEEYPDREALALGLVARFL